MMKILQASVLVASKSSAMVVMAKGQGRWIHLFGLERFAEFYQKLFYFAKVLLIIEGILTVKCLGSIHSQLNCALN